MVPRFEDWGKWRENFTCLPAVASRPCNQLPTSWLPWWRQSPSSALLETGKSGRFTILVPTLTRLLIAAESHSELIELDPSRAGNTPTVLATYPGDPLTTLRSFLRRHRSPQLTGLPFTAGLVGYLSYDLARLLEKLPATALPDLDIPLAIWGIAEKFFVFDPQEKVLHAVANRHVSAETEDAELALLFTDASTETEKMLGQWENTATPSPPASTPLVAPTSLSPAFSISRDEFITHVAKIQKYIRAGDTYQVNLSVRESRPLHTSPEAVYEELRRINPSPYMGLLRFPDLTLVSGSPELLVRVRDGKIEARPIAGTRPRGTDGNDDIRLHQELIDSSKEQAEHLMLVDLIRNDLGRVSEFGTVRVSEFMTVENYSHVMHIVSHIEGKPAPGKDLCDVIAATFPGGTITGAPKIRTMEIIEELEPVRRGPYTGSIGWIGFNGEMELNITIRTLVATGGVAHVQAGAGIVADSDPESEYEESLNKAKALWAAVEAAEAKLAPVSPQP